MSTLPQTAWFTAFRAFHPCAHGPGSSLLFGSLPLLGASLHYCWGLSVPSEALCAGVQRETQSPTPRHVSGQPQPSLWMAEVQPVTAPPTAHLGLASTWEEVQASPGVAGKAQRALQSAGWWRKARPRQCCWLRCGVFMSQEIAPATTAPPKPLSDVTGSHRRGLM